MMWALMYKLSDLDPQLTFDFDDTSGWVGPMFWPSELETPEEIVEEFCNSLPNRSITARVIGKYENKGDKWHLTPLK